MRGTCSGGDMSHWLVSPSPLPREALLVQLSLLLSARSKPFLLSHITVRMVTHGLQIVRLLLQLLVAFIMVPCRKALDFSSKPAPVRTVVVVTGVSAPFRCACLQGLEIWPWTIISNISVCSRQITLKFLNSLGHTSLPLFSKLSHMGAWGAGPRCRSWFPIPW